MSPWVRIDENAMEHPKIAGLPDGAFRLWVQGMAHCQKFLTDGAIDRVSLRGLRAYSPKRVADLVAARLWLPAENDGIQVHDYLQWNESRAHVLKVREQGRERIKKLRGRNAGSNAVTTREQSANDLRSYSGGVVCSSSQPVFVGREGGVGETTAERIGEFVDYYRETHQRIFGVAYMGHPQNDYHAAKRLVETFTDEQLRDAVLVWFGMNDDFARQGTRTIPKFASRASKCVELAGRVA